MLESLTWKIWPIWNQPGAWQHIFPDKLRLSALTGLDIADTMPWEVSDLDGLVSSCSHLQALSLCCSPDLQLAALLQLTALTHLWLTGATKDSTVTSLVQLSALQDLQELFVMALFSFTSDDAIKSLTTLTQLTRLGLSDIDGVFSPTLQQQLLQGFGKQNMYGSGVTCHTITNTAPEGATPDVWSQLLSLCADCAQATQQHVGALDVALEQQQQLVALAAPPQQPQHDVEAPQQQVGEPPQQQQQQLEEPSPEAA